MNNSTQGGGGAATCYIKKSLSYKSSFCPNVGNIFIDISWPKSNLILIGVLYRSPYKLEFIEHLYNSLRESNISNIQEFYLMGDFNIILLKENKMLLDKQYFDSHDQAPPSCHSSISSINEV